MPKFTDENLELIFGAEDAENERRESAQGMDPSYKNKAYESLRATLPLRIVVGHKGVGKSALLKMASIEDEENKVPTLFIKPSDVSTIWSQTKGDLNSLIEICRKREYCQLYRKCLLTDLLVHFDKYSGLKTPTSISNLTIGLIKFANEKLNSISQSANAELTKSFLNNSRINVYIRSISTGVGKQSPLI